MNRRQFINAAGAVAVGRKLTVRPTDERARRLREWRALLERNRREIEAVGLGPGALPER